MKSDAITQGFEKTGQRALLHATGVTPESFGKPMIGIASAFTDLVPGQLAQRKACWQQPRPRFTAGYLSKYVKLVSSSADGAVCNS